MENENVVSENVGDTNTFEVSQENNGSEIVTEIAKPARVITSEILNQAQIRCGMNQDEIDTRVAAVFDRLESV